MAREKTIAELFEEYQTALVKFDQARRAEAARLDEEMTAQREAVAARERKELEGQAMAIGWLDAIALLVRPDHIQKAHPIGDIRHGIGIVLSGKRNVYRINPEELATPGALRTARIHLVHVLNRRELDDLVEPVRDALDAAARLDLPVEDVVGAIVDAGTAYHVVDFVLSEQTAFGRFSVEAGKLSLGRRHPDRRTVLNGRPYDHIERLENALKMNFSPSLVLPDTMTGSRIFKATIAANQEKAAELRRILTGEYDQALQDLREMCGEI